MTALEATGLSKRFGANKALDGVDLEVAAGEVLALMGANGAGKSTLVKILCGVYGADAGSIVVGGKTLLADSPRQARARGILAVHQTIADTGVPTVSVADNLLLDRYARATTCSLPQAQANIERREGLQRASVSMSTSDKVKIYGVDVSTSDSRRQAARLPRPRHCVRALDSSANRIVRAHPGRPFPETRAHS
jgi:simple sugar transport system ATP-binding protein